MAMQDRKREDRKPSLNAAAAVSVLGHELTHSEDFARNGDYLGRQPGDLSGRNHLEMAMRGRVFTPAESGPELTHSEDFACNGDYLGRQPGDVSGNNHFDEEYFVDESENENDAEMPVKQELVPHH